MVVIIPLDNRDLANIRFAYSPLTELTLSYRLLKLSDTFDVMRHRWMDEAISRLDGVELRYMDAVIDGHHFVPDFVVPPVEGSNLKLEDQLKAMYDVPAHLIASDMQIMVDERGMTAEREQFIKDPHGMLPCLIEEMWLYWNCFLSHHWARISATLENDVFYRARQLATQGVKTMLDDLHEKIEYNDNEQLILHKIHTDKCKIGALEGRGLLFYPTLFESGLLWQVDDKWHPSIGYDARGSGLWYEPPKIETEEAIELTLGASKARLLVALQEPNTTSDLAHLLHLTAGAVSQQLTKLTQAGLIVANRSGNRVYYKLSNRGSQLLQVFSA